MSLTDLASLGSFVSGVAVAVTLVFLVVQLRQNTRAVKGAASQAHSAAYQELSNIIVVNGDMARIWRVGNSDMAKLNDDERVRYIAYLSGIFRFMESARVQWQLGQLDREHWFELETEIKDFAMQPGVRSYWEIRRHWHAEEFRRFFDSLPKAGGVPNLYGTNAS
jgi:hypothetical protein